MSLYEVYNSLNKLKNLPKPITKPKNKGKVIKFLHKLGKNILIISGKNNKNFLNQIKRQNHKSTSKI